MRQADLLSSNTYFGGTRHVCRVYGRWREIMPIERSQDDQRHAAQCAVIGAVTTPRG
jgi:hypothetical protein